MKTNDVVMFALGFVAGYFLKNQWDKRSSVLANSTDETNYVFSQKYKDCEAKANKVMEQSKFKNGVDLDAYKKSKIEECMNNS
jgi:hypothetical protein